MGENDFIRFLVETPFYLYLDEGFSIETTYENHEIISFVHNNFVKYTSIQDDQVISIFTKDKFDDDLSYANQFHENKTTWYRTSKPKAIIEVKIKITKNKFNSTDYLQKTNKIFIKFIQKFLYIYSIIFNEYEIPIESSFSFILPSSYFNRNNTMMWKVIDSKEENLVYKFDRDLNFSSRKIKKEDSNSIKQYFNGKKIIKKFYALSKIKENLDKGDIETVITYTISYFEYIVKKSLARVKNMDMNNFDSIFKDQGMSTFLNTQLPLLLIDINGFDKNNTKKWLEDFNYLNNDRTNIIHRLAEIKNPQYIIEKCKSLIDLCEMLEKNVLKWKNKKKKLITLPMGISTAKGIKGQNIEIMLLDSHKLGEIAKKSIKSLKFTSKLIDDVLRDPSKYSKIETNNEDIVQAYLYETHLHLFLLCHPINADRKTILQLEKALFEETVKKSPLINKQHKIHIHMMHSGLMDKTNSCYIDVLKEIYGAETEVKSHFIYTLEKIKELNDFFKKKRLRTKSEILQKEIKIGYSFISLCKDRGDGNFKPSELMYGMFKKISEDVVINHNADL